MPENTFETLESVADKIKSDLDSDPKKIGLLYAFNATGKTRLSSFFDDNESGEEKALIYSAFFEDLFVWDNREYVFNLDSDSKIINFISEQGLENQITENFQRLTLGSKIFPLCSFAAGEVTFSYSPGDDRGKYNVKISRGEESLFVWSVFYTVLDTVISILNTSAEDRETSEFNNLEYIIIDDPVSSIDDTKIISMAVALINLINSANNDVKFLITTHHPLFYNILFNQFIRKKKAIPWVLFKDDTNFELKEQGDDSPFGYHLALKDVIKKSIDSNSLQKYHFNLFRGLLEKTSNFLGYNNWTDCLEGESKEEIKKLVNLYSHGKLSELESRHFPDEHKLLFTKVFNDFIERFKWKA